jgi:hypothetical protein
MMREAVKSLRHPAQSTVSIAVSVAVCVVKVHVGFQPAGGSGAPVVVTTVMVQSTVGVKPNVVPTVV